MENVIIKFVADTSGLEPAVKQLELLGKISKDDAAAFAQINNEQKEFIQNLNKSTTEFGKLNAEVEGLMAEIQAGVMEGFADYLAEVTKGTKQAGTGFKSLKQELRELKAQIASGTLGEKELKEATKRAAELTNHLGDVSDKVRAIASDTKRIDAVVTAFRGIAAAASVAAGAASLFGSENEKLTQTLAKAQGAMALLQGVQELANIATKEGALKTMILDGAQKAVTATSRVMGITIAQASALATGGLTLLTGAIAYLVTEMMFAEDEEEKFQKRMETLAGNAQSAKKQTDLMVSLIKDGKQKELTQLKVAYEREKLEIKKSKADGAMIERETYLLHKKYLDDVAAVNEKYNKDEADKMAKEAEKRVKAVKDAHDREYRLLEEWRRKREKMIDELRQAAVDMEKADVEDKINARKHDRKEFEKDILERMAIQKAANDKEIAELMKLLQSAGKEREKAYTEWGKFALEQAQVVSDTIFTINAQNTQHELDTKLADINELRDAELSNKELTEAQRLQIEKRYRLEEAKIKKQAWEAQKQADLAQAIINGALAVSKAWATVPPPANIPAAIAAGVATAAQVAIIENTKPPKFEKGGFVDGNLHASGGTIIEAERGEYVINRHSTADYLPAIKAINDGSVEPTFANNILTALSNGSYQLAAQFQSKESAQEVFNYHKLGNILERHKSTVNISIDENGFNKMIEKSHSRTTFRNAKLRIKA